MSQKEKPNPENMSEQTKDKPNRPIKVLLLWVVLLFVFFMLFKSISGTNEKPENLNYYPDFVSLVEKTAQKDSADTANNARRIIRSCELVREASGGEYVTGEIVDTKTGETTKFKVDVVMSHALTKWLADNQVNFTIKRQKVDFWQILQSILPFLLVLAILYFLFIRQIRSAGQGAMSFGKSRARLLQQDKNKITFSDVAGIEEAKEEVQEIVEFLKDPKKFQMLGGRMPTGVLLMGPPGTGKTLMAKAIAGEADVPFFSISGSDFVEMFVGVGASRVRDMFEQGKKNAPCIIFIDEIDAVGRSRFTGIGGGHDEREQTLNALLVEMDGFETQEGVIIIAATNRPDVLDQALLRPGRFDRQIVIDLPLLEGRVGILNIHAKNIKLSPSVDLKRIARGTPGFSGADLANLVNEAALLAAREGKDSVENEDLEEARDKVKWGRERRSRILDDEEKKLTAYHECGHALVLHFMPKSEPIHKMTIVPRGNAYLGATMQLPLKDRYTESLSRLKGTLAGLMGGRAAEQIVFDDVTTGAGNDLKEATHLARLMVCNWGMSVGLGPQTFGANEEVMFLGREVARNQDFSDETARKIDLEVNKFLKEAYETASSILTEHRDRLDLLAEKLLEQETLDGEDIVDLIKFGAIRERPEPKIKATEEKTTEDYDDIELPDFLKEKIPSEDVDSAPDTSADDGGDESEEKKES